MKSAILECLFLFLCCFAMGSFVYLIDMPAWIQHSFFFVMIAPVLWFIPKRILIELEK